MSSSFLKYVLIVSIYFGVFFIILALIISFFSLEHAWNSFDFLIWDAEHLYSIVRDGYSPTTCAFFPLFPLFWKLLNCSATLISVVNFVVFIVSSAFLFKEYKANILQTLLSVAIPSLLFMILPYSEALLYSLTVLLILSLRRDLNYLVFIALFMMSLTKPTASIFIPAVIIAEILSNGNLRSKIRHTCLFLLAIILGNVMVFWYQKLATGNWFDFFQAQADWGNKLGIPKLPLTTWSAPQVIWIDAVSFWISMMASAILLYLFVRWLKFNHNFSRSLIYSLIYLAGTGWYVLLFRNGALFSLNRFILGTPFLLIALYELKTVFGFLSFKRILLFCGVGFLLLSLFFGSFLHIRTLFFYLLLDALLVIWLTIFMEEQTRKISWVVLPIMMGFQLIYAVILLNGGWLA